MLRFDPCKYTYSSRRNVVYAKNGMACTSAPLGAQVGLEVLKSGGNAMDAADRKSTRLNSSHWS